MCPSSWTDADGSSPADDDNRGPRGPSGLRTALASALAAALAAGCLLGGVVSGPAAALTTAMPVPVSVAIASTTWAARWPVETVPPDPGLEPGAAFPGRALAAGLPSPGPQLRPTCVEALAPGPLATPGDPGPGAPAPPADPAQAPLASPTARAVLDAQLAQAQTAVARLDGELHDAGDRLQVVRGCEQEVAAGLEASAAEMNAIAGDLPRLHADVAAAERRRAELAAGLAHDQQDLAMVQQAVAAGQQEVDARTAAAEQGRAVLAELGQRVTRADAALRATSRRAAKASAFARADIPRDYLQRYQSAAGTCRGLSWPVLAAVGRMESAHGRSDDAGVHSGANQAGAMGPMQFLAGTWAAYGADGDGDGERDIYNPDDAVLGAADYLCAAGAGRLDHLRDALWAYNHADWYVAAVLDVAARYGADLSGLPPPPPAPAGASTGS